MTHNYAYPSPHQFLGIKSERKALYLAVWLASRAGWTHYVHTAYATGSLPGATRTQWREWLASSHVAGTASPSANVNSAVLPTTDPGNGSVPVTKVLSPVRSSKKSGKAAMWSKAKREEAKHLFRSWIPDVTFPQHVYWKEKAFQFGDSAGMTPAVTAEILWDLFEHNWRFELLALDRAIHLREWSGEEWASDRDAALRAVFFGGSFLVGPMPSRNRGLAADELEMRLPFLQAFKNIMQSWPDAPASWNDVLLEGDVDTAKVLALEDALVCFYCQTFFNFTGRCPITPHRLPSTSGCLRVP
jgi:hypothetical protein